MQSTLLSAQPVAVPTEPHPPVIEGVEGVSSFQNFRSELEPRADDDFLQSRASPASRDLNPCLNASQDVPGPNTERWNPFLNMCEYSALCRALEQRFGNTPGTHITAFRQSTQRSKETLPEFAFDLR